MAHHMDVLVIAIVYTALGLTAFVVVVGGIVCVTDDQYPFKQYIADLRQMSNWVLAAAIVVAAKLIAPYVKVVREKANGTS